MNSGRGLTLEPASPVGSPDVVEQGMGEAHKGGCLLPGTSQTEARPGQLPLGTVMFIYDTFRSP